MEWWGYNNEHGWVVLDRNNPPNRPGIKGDLHFLRCRDWKPFEAKRESWNPPLYRYAPNYIAELGPAASAESAAELALFKADFPAVQRELLREVEEAEAKVEAARIAEEKEQKKLVREKKKQDGLAAKAAEGAD